MKYRIVLSKILATALSVGMLVSSIPQAVLCVSAENTDEETASSPEMEDDNSNPEDVDDAEDSTNEDGIVDDEDGAEAGDSTGEDGDADTEENTDAEGDVETEDGDTVVEDSDSEVNETENTDSDDGNTETESQPDEEKKNILTRTEIAGYIVTVYAQAGVFPEGTEVSVSIKEEQRGIELEDAILLKNDIGFYVEEIEVFDIDFSFEGKEIRADGGKAVVSVTLADDLKAISDKAESEIKVFPVNPDNVVEDNILADADELLLEGVVSEADLSDGKNIFFVADNYTEYALAIITKSNEEEPDFGYFMTDKEDSIDYTYYDAPTSDYGMMTFNADMIESRYVTASLPGLRDQNPYGTCWAHSAMALGEIYLMNNTDDSGERDFSELQLSYFTYNNVEDPLGGTAGDTNRYTGAASGLLDQGGNLVYAGRQLASWQGATLEEKAPYNSTYQALACEGGLPEALAYDDAAHLTNFYQIEVSDPANFDDAKRLIKENGALGVSIYAYSSEYSAKAAHAYSSANYAYYVPTPMGANGGRGTNHAVTIVGWDDDFSAGNFLTDPGADGAWLIRNSWDTTYDGDIDDDFGYYSYFWLSYYDANVSKGVSYTFDSADNYDNNYQYDGNLVSGYLNYNSAANIFTAKACQGGEMLEATSFNTLSQNASFTIDVYTNLSDMSNPTSGTLATSVSGSFRYSGYYTVPFDDGVPLSEGDVFTVVVTIEDGAGSGSIGVEDTDISPEKNIEFVSAAAPGQSFVKGTTKWLDVGKQKGSNVRIKAFTTNLIPVSEIRLAGNIASAGVKIAENKTFTPTWEVLPANATDKNVVWTSSDERIAVVDAMTGTVTAVSAGKAVITAAAAAGGKTVSYTVTIPENSYSISYVLNGGSNNSKNPTVYTKKTSTITLKKPVRTGYTFVGWYTSDTYKKKITEIKKGSTGDKILYAKWKANKYKVKYAANGGTGTMVESNCTYDKAFTLKPNKFKRKGYRFVGWATSKKGAVVYNNQEQITTNLKSKNGAVKTLYAKWEVINYSINYNNTEGASIGSNPATYTVKKSVKLKKASKPGYTFKGWYTNAKLTKKITGIAKGTTGNKKLYAKWEVNKYNIQFDVNGGTGVLPGNMKGTYSPAVVLPYASLTRPGFSFGGWMDDKGNVYLPGDSIAPFATSTKGTKVVLYAKWIPD